MGEGNKNEICSGNEFCLCLNIYSRLGGAHHCRCMYGRGPLEQNGPRVCVLGLIELWLGEEVESTEWKSESSLKH